MRIPLCIALCLFGSPVLLNLGHAQPPHPPDRPWKKEIASDRKEIAEQKSEIKDNAGDAREKEQELRQQIQDAVDQGDHERARELREQLKELHQQNVQEKLQDKKELGEARGKLKQDRHRAPGR
ncbi:MAG: hypothetical protein NT045_06275 [Candidatus Aureabacteria bacterium]|nr:hypothetical protein [Candidatus Auribacterota bacterium]